jgi:hypothetical protein
MTDEPSVPRPRLLGVDAAPPDYYAKFQFEDFIRSMQKTMRNQPHPVELRVGSWFFDEVWRTFQREGIETPIDVELPESVELLESREEISIFLVVTDVRVVFHDIQEEDKYEPCYQAPEYEVEGWLLDPPGNPDARVWVRGMLKRTPPTDELAECTLYLLNSGEERGTEETPGML